MKEPGNAGKGKGDAPVSVPAPEVTQPQVRIYMHGLMRNYMCMCVVCMVYVYGIYVVRSNFSYIHLHQFNNSSSNPQLALQ